MRYQYMRLLYVTALLAAVMTLPASAGARSLGCVEGAQEVPVTLSGGSATVGGCVLAADNGVVAYAGIPFAEPPTGAGRWQPPRLRELPESGTYTAFGNMCVQPDQDNIDGRGNEDCLTINVWTPRRPADDARKLPVMVFIYGGAFAAGSGEEAYYDGTRLAAEGVVVVSFNYRVGALGFLHDDRITTGGTIGGNLGMMDQQTALVWINRHVAAFGGDPGAITIFGESAGGNSVALHTFDMPASALLFQRAIVESNPFGADFPTLAEASEQGEAFLEKLCSGFLTSAPAGATCDAKTNPALWQPRPPTAAEIMHAQGQATLNLCPAGETCIKDLLRWGVTWTPLVDNKVVFDKPINGYYRGADGKAAPSYKPILLGFTRHEGAVFVGLPFTAHMNYFTQDRYTAALSEKFGSAEGILASPCEGHPESDGLCYDPAHLKTNPAETVVNGAPTYPNRVALALANVLSDFHLRCGTLKAANTLLADDNGGQEVHVFEFAQPPYYSYYSGKDTGVCEPEVSWPDPSRRPLVFHTCHANELPYVFDTLDTLSYPATKVNFRGAEVHYTPTVNDRRLARTMISLWTSFAKGALPDTWPRYRKGGEAIEFLDTGPTAALRTIRPDRDANCSALWLSEALVGAYPK